MRDYFVEIKDLVVANSIGDKSDVVYKVDWFYVCKDSSVPMIVSSEHALQLDVSDLSTFTNFSSLTKEQVVSWVESSLTESDITNLKAELDKKIEEHVMSLSKRPFPWATTP